MVRYKYVSASSAIRILEEMRLKVALPSECNDPFECTPRTRVTTCGDMLRQLENDPEHFRPLYDEHVQQGLFSAPFSEFLQGLPEQIKERSPEVRKLIRPHFVISDLNARNEVSQHFG